MSESISLTPTLSGNTPEGDLYKYFEDKLPDNLSPDYYNAGLGCEGFARLIVLELGGPDQARIYRVEGTEWDEVLKVYLPSHAFVIHKNNQPTDLAYNNDRPYFGRFLTVAEVREVGEDVTDEIFETPWDML